MHKMMITFAALLCITNPTMAQSSKKDTYPFFQKSENTFGEKSPFDVWKSSSPKSFSSSVSGKSAQVAEWEARLFIVREEIKLLKQIHDANQEIALKSKASISPMDDTFRTLNMRRAEERQLLKNLGLLADNTPVPNVFSSTLAPNAAWQR